MEKGIGMKAIAAISVLAFLAACGVDGAPQQPRYSTETTIGYNSKTGPFNKTKFSVEFGG